MKKNILYRAAIAAAIFAISACTTTTAQRTGAEHQTAEKEALLQTEQLKRSILEASAARLAAQEVNRPYISGNAIPLERGIQMPAILRSPLPVTAKFSANQVELAIALQQMASATGISITATPDAYMSASAFGPKTGLAAAQIQAPPRVTLKSTPMPIWKALDDIASQGQLAWRPTALGAEFYRVKTASYELMTIPQTATSSASLGRNGGGNSVFDSQSKTSFASGDQNQIAGIRLIVDAMLTVGGKMSISPENQTLIVTDTPQAHERIATFVKEQNKAMGRRVRVLVEAIEVISKDGSDVGIDWALVYNTTANALSSSSVGGLTSAQSGVLSIQQMIGKFTGSGAVLKALNEVGVVVNRRVFPFVTTSGRPITQALRSTFNYVDQVQTVATSNSSTQATPAPTVTQKDETVGTLLTLIPTAKSDGSTIFLSISYDVTSAEPLRPFTVGSGNSAVTVQQKTVNGSGVIQELPIRSGRTEVIGGVELQSSQSTARRLGDGIPMVFGGGSTASNTKSMTVLLVTAVTEDGL